MYRRSIPVGLAVFVMTGIFAFAAISAEAAPGYQDTGGDDDRNLWWDRFDVRIDNINTAANQFDVTETYELTIERGPYSLGFRELPLDRVTGIDNVQVSQDGQALRVDCSGAPGTLCVTTSDDALNITYYFLQPVQSGDTPTIELRYTVTGALRAYDEGDELFWAALPEDLFGFDVLESRVMVFMPMDVSVLNTASYPATWKPYHQKSTLMWLSPERPIDDGLFEVRVAYSHDPAMPKPSWQRAYDRHVWYEDNVQPIVSLFWALITALLG